MTGAEGGAAERPPELEPGRLLWRCRRGMKELDVVLERYVRSQLAGAALEQRRRFARLLELPDPVLADYLFGHAAPPDPELRELTSQITEAVCARRRSP